MKGKWTFVGSIMAVLVLALAVGLTQAQGPEPPEGVGAQGDVGIAAVVNSRISYQGVLKENGQPVNGTRNMVFRFYTTSNCTGTPVQEVTKNNVQVSNGLFKADLDVTQNHFNGQGLWVAVDVGGTVVGCQEILPVPYALSLRPGAIISGTEPVLSTRGLEASGELATVQLISVSPFVAVSVGAKGEGQWGVYGYSSSAIGVRGESGTSATSGTGVYGLAGSTSGTTYGVYGKAQSVGGYGGYFENRAATTSAGGTGVYGEGALYGVYGKAIGVTPSGSVWPPLVYGVFGKAEEVSGRAGVYIGVQGEGTTAGVRGFSDGAGVVGTATSTSGINYGVKGRSGSSAGYGGYFENTSSGVALYARTDSGSGNIIEAWSSSTDREFRVERGGDVRADGSFIGGGADYAELLPGTSGLEPGDVLVINPEGQLNRSTEPYETTVVGVYSTKPGFVAGAGDESAGLSGMVPLAVMGIVPVKVSAENGPIRPGDLLVASSTPGHAMKAGPNPPAGTVIGKALEGLEEGTGVIRMLVMLR